MRYPPLVAHFAEMEIRQIEEFRRFVKAHHQRDTHALEELARQTPEDDEYTDRLTDEWYELENTLALAEQWPIVALYRVTEATTLSILSHTPFASKVPKSIYRFDALRRVLKDHQVALDRVPHFAAANELRLLNNAIKHSGKVTAELAEFSPRWQFGAVLDHLGEAFDRLRPRVPRYLLRLAERTKADWRIPVRQGGSVS